MSKSSRAVKEWRKNTKQRIIAAMGNECQICKYDKCSDALELHHIDSSKKDFGLGAIRANPKNWNLIVEELKKCILLCSNCHREVHSGISALPEVYNKFDDAFLEYKSLNKEISLCPICKKEKLKTNKTCSLSCAAKLSRKINWDKFDLLELKKTMSFVDIANLCGVSDVAVRKRYLKLLAGNVPGETCLTVNQE